MALDAEALAEALDSEALVVATLSLEAALVAEAEALFALTPAATLDTSEAVAEVLLAVADTTPSAALVEAVDAEALPLKP